MSAPGILAVEEAWIIDAVDAPRMIADGWQVSGPARGYQGDRESVIVVRPIECDAAPASAPPEGRGGA